MSITMINNTQKPFVVVNKAIAMDKDLNMRDRGMMLTLMSFPPEWNFSIKGLEKIVPDGRDAISSSLQRLEENDTLFVYRRGMKKVNSLIPKYISILILRKIR